MSAIWRASVICALLTYTCPNAGINIPDSKYELRFISLSSTKASCACSRPDKFAGTVQALIKVCYAKW